jgi:secondary thiamine-phosphate synthase enzyme
MVVETRYLELETTGGGVILNITEGIRQCVEESSLQNGTVTVFTPSATSGITTLEYESGCIQDLQRLFDEIIDPERDYAHNLRWGDGNGHSHTRAALLKPSLVVPIVQGDLTLGIWQSIIFVDFDNRTRSRRLVVQIMGE